MIHLNHRDRSKKVELLVRYFNHASLKMSFYKGFPTLGWSEGYTFMTIDFSLLSSQTSQINGISLDTAKRTSQGTNVDSLPYNQHLHKSQL